MVGSREDALDQRSSITAESRFGNAHDSFVNPSTTRQCIVYLTAVWPFHAGREVFFVPELTELAHSDVRLRIVPRDVLGARPEAEIPCLLAASVYSVALFAPTVLFAAALETICRPLRLLRCILLLLSSIDACLVRNLAVLPKAIWLARFARMSEATHIHAQWGGTTATMAMIASRLSGIPWSVTYHRNDIERANLLKLKLQDASFVRFISEEGMALAKRKAGSPLRSNAHVIHLGIEIPALEMEREPIDRSTPVLCCSASLIQLKGHAVLFDALAQLKSDGFEFRLLVAGDGPLRGVLEHKCRELGLDQAVDFLGHVPHAQLLSAYSSGAIDILTLPSFIEGIPVSVMEASAYRIPSVASDVGGLAELLGDGAGVLTPAGDVNALARAIKTLLRDPSLRRRLGSAARQRVEESFDARQTTTSFLDQIAQSSSLPPIELFALTRS
jgi:glycosyltransferase involved in cell wall biosynthesis